MAERPTRRVFARVVSARVASARVASVSGVIHGLPRDLVEVLADPAGHGEIDGCGMVPDVRGESKRLEPGSTFGMEAWT